MQKLRRLAGVSEAEASLPKSRSARGIWIAEVRSQIAELKTFRFWQASEFLAEFFEVPLKILEIFPELFPFAFRQHHGMREKAVHRVISLAGSLCPTGGSLGS